MKTLESRLNSYRKNVAAIIQDQNGLILVGRRVDSCGYGDIQLPQGGIEIGESEEEALKREIFEETRIQHYSIIRKATQLFRYDFRIGETREYRGQEQRFFLLSIEESEKNRLEPTEELFGFQFLTPDQIVNAIVDFKRETYIRAFTHFGLVNYDNYEKIEDRRLRNDT